MFYTVNELSSSTHYICTHMFETADWSTTCVIATDVFAPFKDFNRDHWEKKNMDLSRRYFPTMTPLFVLL